MKRLMILLIIICSFGLWASDVSGGVAEESTMKTEKDCHDFALVLGQDNFLWDSKGLEATFGFSLGLSERLEVRATGSSTVIPKIFEKNLISVELCYDVLDVRNTGTRVSGINIGIGINAGMFYKTHDNGWGILVGVDPLWLMGPSVGRRERIFSTRFGWDFHNNEAVVSFSLIDFDLYLRGTYRDWM